MKINYALCCICRYIQAELVHSRFAMAAVAGILIPEVRRAGQRSAAAHSVVAGGPCTLRILCLQILSNSHALQLLKKFGVLSLPAWYEAGKYAQESSPIPFSKSPLSNSCEFLQRVL